MSVTKVIELSASSSQGIEDAVRHGLEKASKTGEEHQGCGSTTSRCRDAQRRRHRMARQHADQFRSRLMRALESVPARRHGVHMAGRVREAAMRLTEKRGRE